MWLHGAIDAGRMHVDSIKGMRRKKKGGGEENAKVHLVSGGMAEKCIKRVSVIQCVSKTWCSKQEQSSPLK